MYAYAYYAIRECMHAHACMHACIVCWSAHAWHACMHACTDRKSGAALVLGLPQELHHALGVERVLRQCHHVVEAGLGETPRCLWATSRRTGPDTNIHDNAIPVSPSIRERTENCAIHRKSTRAPRSPEMPGRQPTLVDWHAAALRLHFLRRRIALLGQAEGLRGVALAVWRHVRWLMQKCRSSSLAHAEADILRTICCITPEPCISDRRQNLHQSTCGQSVCTLA